MDATGRILMTGGQDCERYFCRWVCLHDRSNEGIEIEMVVLADTNEVILGSHSAAPLHSPPVLSRGVPRRESA